MAGILQIGISRNTKCDNTVGFVKSGHILSYCMCCYLKLNFSIQSHAAQISTNYIAVSIAVKWYIQKQQYFSMSKTCIIIPLVCSYISHKHHYFIGSCSLS